MRRTAGSLVVALVVLLDAGCQRAPSGSEELPPPPVVPCPVTTAATTVVPRPPADGHPKLAHGWKPTPELVVGGDLRRAVDRLASFGSMASEVPGLGAKGPPPPYVAFKAVTELANRPESIALLSHESPVVRAYLATWVGDNWPDAAWDVYALFADETPVDRKSGDVGFSESVALVAFHALSDAHDGNLPGDKLALVETAAKDDRLPSEVRGAAIEELAEASDASARALANGALDGGDPLLRASGARAIALIGTREDVPRGVSLLTEKNEAMRRAGAELLARFPSTVGADALRASVEHKDAPRRDIAQAYAVQPGIDRAVIARLLADRATEDGAVTGLAKRADTEALELLLPLLLKDDPKGPGADTVAAFTRDVRPECFPAMRRLLDSANPSTVMVAAAYLGRAGDRGSVPALATLLHSENEKLQIAGVAALEAVRDPSVVAPLEGALSDVSDEVVIRAARALVALHAVSALPALRARFKRTPRWDVSWDELRLAIRALEGPTRR